MEKPSFVYIDKKPCGEIFYVGQGQTRRVKQEKRNRFHSFVAQKNKGWSREIVFTGTEAECLIEEQRLIALHGRRDLGTGTLVNLTNGGEGTKCRVVGQAERDRLSKAWQSQKNPLFNQTVFDWVNLDTGEHKAETIYAMHLAFGGCRAHWTSVANGARKSHYGWAMKATKINVRSVKGKTLSFKHASGEVFSGTCKAFAERIGVSAASVSRLVTGVHPQFRDWVVNNG
jgi:hypothetical protein